MFIWCNKHFLKYLSSSQGVWIKAFDKYFLFWLGFNIMFCFKQLFLLSIGLGKQCGWTQCRTKAQADCSSREPVSGTFYFCSAACCSCRISGPKMCSQANISAIWHSCKYIPKYCLLMYYLLEYSLWIPSNFLCTVSMLNTIILFYIIIYSSVPNRS